MNGDLLLWTAVLGGVAGMDVVTFPQAMISRPIVAATAAGALCGNALAGLIAGAALEMLAMELLPVGASRYPEWGSAAVAGGAVAASPAAHASPAAALLLAIVTALGTAWLGGWTMHGLRRLNGYWSVRARPRLDAGDARYVAALQWRGLGFDFARAAILTIASVSAAALVAPAALARINANGWLLVMLAAALGAAVAGSSAWRFAAAAPRARWVATALFAIAGAVAAGVLP